ncbi:hypothetical protein SK128_002861 [Halocaridina rubra]|uniref:Uncharacterized protein n=1 Tax=Halocaridina rubra TaxID=373956 RepID=A0AAN8XLD7_HALRR
MSVSPFILTRPTYSFINTLVNSVTSIPADNPDEEPVLRGFVSFVFPITILLDALIEEIEGGRSMGDEQIGVYQSIGQRLSLDYGIDGKECILRFICELQKRPISKWTVFGQLLTVLFTPISEGNRENLDMLKAYMAAQTLGSTDADCGSVYRKCDFSVFHYFEALQNVTSLFQSATKEEEDS